MAVCQPWISKPALQSTNSGLVVSILSLSTAVPFAFPPNKEENHSSSSIMLLLPYLDKGKVKLTNLGIVLYRIFRPLLARRSTLLTVRTENPRPLDMVSDLFLSLS